MVAYYQLCLFCKILTLFCMDQRELLHKQLASSCV
ncbi:hypothetical protein BofuT4_uP062750.1 [Botrytis cinerea T4]|uniref:Uncharacterized protein n=1 Tax=Botryotinia fuckeliana (strain T4) TaxID=999810 RepID=G2XTK9_BOTF4|nr:hypothetical protein BofuT4_uP062750.1 [Botrytis cinerea T4]